MGSGEGLECQPGCHSRLACTREVTIHMTWLGMYQQNNSLELDD